MNYFKEFLKAFQLALDISKSSVRLIVYPIGLIWRIHKKEYVIFLAAPKYCLMLTNENGYPICEETWFWKYKHLHLMHVVRMSITNKQIDHKI